MDKTKDLKTGDVILIDDEFKWVFLSYQKDGCVIVQIENSYNMSYIEDISSFDISRVSIPKQKKKVPLTFHDVKFGDELTNDGWIQDDAVYLIGKCQATVKFAGTTYTYQELFNDPKYKINGKECWKYEEDK